MKKRDISLVDFIKENVGIELSRTLEAYIRDPSRLYKANKKVLWHIVFEYGPIYQKYRNVLDGSKELSKLCYFELVLMEKIRNNLELIELLNKPFYICDDRFMADL